MSKLLTILRANKSPFRPTNIDGLQLWLDAADTSTIVESGGDVSQWNDKSGNGNHVSQAVAANQPATGASTQNGLNVLDFASDHLISVRAASTWQFLLDGSEYAAFAVVKAGTVANPNAALAWLSTEIVSPFSYFVWLFDNRSVFGRNNQITHEVSINGSTIALNRLNDTMTPNEFHVTSLMADVDNATASLRSTQYVDGGTAITENTSTNAPSSVSPNRTLAIGYAGAGIQFTGSIAEILVYDSALSDTNREAVQEYLAAKWGITIPGTLGSFTWDSNTSSPAASQVTDATVTNVHLGMRRCVVNDAGVVQYYLNPFDSTEKADGTAANLDGTDGQVMVEIPKFYTRRVVSGTETTWFVSDKPRIGFSVHPAFVKDGVEVDYRYYGAYHASVYAPATGSITATTEDNPVKITSNNHGLETNCQVTITGTGIAELDDESFVVTKVDSNNFTLNGLDGTGIGTAATGTWEQTYLSGLNLNDTSAIIATGTTNELASVSGVYPIVGLTRDEARSLAANRGSVWRQLDFTLWSAVQLLYLVEYQTFNSQSVLGNGNTNDSYVASSSDQADSPHSIAGRSNSLGNASTDTTSGANTVTDPPTAFMSYRGIENWYGNGWQCADGINVNVGSTGNAHVTNNRADFADDTSTNMTLLTTSSPTASGYIQTLQDVNDYFIALSVAGGSSSTYITDRFSASSSSNRIVIVGGGANDNGEAGAFRTSAFNSSSDANRLVGARLAC